MANSEHLAILKQGVIVWNQWRDKYPDIKPDLSEADLNGARFRGPQVGRTYGRGVNFSNANLTGAKLSRALLPWADLTNADLFMADLSEAYLSGADLSGSMTFYLDLSITYVRVGADLSGANLSDAQLLLANLNGAILDGANLAGAHVGWTKFGFVDLSTAEGLETVQHDGPSIIGIDTLFRSKGKIPEVFLRGCGVPDILIEYARSLVGKPIQFFSCFISHSNKDKRFCARLYADLQSKGVRTWYFPEDAKWGETVWGEIDRSIKIYDKLIVVCSENSLQSGPVLREIERALNREDKEGKNVLFPVRIDSYIFDKWEHERKADVLRKVIGDFSEWDSNATKYEFAFKKLLAGIEAE
ncbi:MAG: toll/interleukin-1 receptor domain-containing protein [Candidatus Marsarchaeota archaeon]|nr:toll/interleukin-1 receptor domain-containing protein [Candidatus Marsarchaeota archaeon]